jgi:BlaI family penicillinase repressor
MARPPSLPGGDLEYAVLAVVWDLGTASIRDIHERVGKPERLVYTTVAKVVDRLYEKGLLERKPQGKAFVYAAARPREEIDRARAHHAVSRVLGEAPKPALANLVDAVEAVDPQLLDELAKLVSARRRSRRGS